MASFGKVLDLLDDRYLELQDVRGNVEPIPTLVPYDEYKSNVLVYSMDTNLDIYTALMQDFTERKAHELRKELWTWCVQWDVEAPSKETVALPPSPKKPRLDTQQSQSPPSATKEKRKGPVLNIVERRIINPALMLEDDMLRCLIDIVQVDSMVVPNFIEFLYRWVDYYEGDGMALKAAMKWEIPSLWEFEYHPLVLPSDRQRGQASRVGSRKSSDGQDAEQPKDSFKEREKPDLAALEEEVEMSERLQYREVHYGIKAPQLKQPLPRLVNIPRDPRRRIKYYAACFKSRQRAFNLLVEAGFTVQQISNYIKQQDPPAKETPSDGEGNGLKNYEKDAKAAQAHYARHEIEMAVRAKHMEAAISNRLAFEARIAARSTAATAAAAGSTGLPLIPATPSYTPRPALELDMLERLQIGRGHGEDRINIVPQPLLGKLKSKLFQGAYELDWYKRLFAMDETLLARSDSERGSFGHEVASSTDDNSDEEETELPSGSWEQLPTNPHISRLPPTLTASSSSLALASAPSSSPAPSLPRPISNPMSTGSPAYMIPPVPVVPSPKRLVTRSLSTEAVDRQRMQILAGCSTIPQATADGDPWTLRQMGYFVDSLPPAERHQMMLQMSPEYAAFAAATRPPWMDAPIVAGPSTASASASVPTGSYPVQSSRAPVPATTLGPSIVSLPRPPPSPFSSQVQTGQPPIQPSSGFGGQMTTALPLRPPMPSSYSDLAPPASAPPAQRRVSSDPAGLNYLLTLGSGGSMQRNNTSGPANSQQQQHILAPQPSLPELPRLPAQSSLPPLPLLSLHPPKPQLPPTSYGPQPFSIANSAMTYPQNNPRPPLQTLAVPFNPSPPRNHMSRPSQPPPVSIPMPSLSGLTPSLGSAQLTTPNFTPTTTSMSIVIYLPKCLRPGNVLGPGGVGLGDAGVRETDALLLGECVPGSGKINLSRAILLPMGIWENIKRRAQKGSWKSMESYTAGRAFDGTKIKGADTKAHQAAYSKVRQIYSIMSTSSNREQELTKRWRTTKGPMTHINRGSVWEGWGVTLDKGIEMGAKERDGAMHFSGMIDDGVPVKRVDEETARQRREIERLIAEDEEDVSDDDEVMET